MGFTIRLDSVQGSVPCRVLAKLQPGVWRVVVGVGIGHLDGGTEQDLPEADLPPSIRFPNATFFMTVTR